MFTVQAEKIAVVASQISYHDAPWEELLGEAWAISSQHFPSSIALCEKGLQKGDRRLLEPLT